MTPLCEICGQSHSAKEDCATATVVNKAPMATDLARLIQDKATLLAALQAACNDVTLLLPLTNGDCGLTDKGRAETQSHLTLYRAAIASVSRSTD